MESLSETYTVRTRDGREFPGFTLSSLQIAIAQKIFFPEDSVRPEGGSSSWTTLARVLALPEPGIPVSTGIALDFDSRSSKPSLGAAPEPRAFIENPYRPQDPSSFAPDVDEGPTRHRLRIAGAFLLFSGILGMVGYAFGKHGVADIITMLINTGLGIALLMNLQQVRKWAVGWVVAGWGLFCGAGILSGGCFGFVLIALISGLWFGGPACLLWGEECPPSRFWAGVTIMGVLVLLGVLGMVLVAIAGATLLQRMHA